MSDLRTPATYVPGHGLLDDRRVVVTAAAGTGIGSAVARRALEEGARVLISDVHERRLVETADRLATETGRRPSIARCDVTVQADVDGLFEAAAEVTNMFLPQVVEVRGVSAGLNVGTGAVHFSASAPVGAQIRARVEVAAADEVTGGVQTTMRITVEARGSAEPAVEGGARPVVVVDALSRWLA